MKTLIITLAKLIGLLPLKPALAFGRGLGWIYGSLIRYHRTDAREALTRAFPEKSPREINSIIKKNVCQSRDERC